MRNLATKAALALAAASTLATAVPALAAPASHAQVGEAVVTGDAGEWQHDRGRHRGWRDRDDGWYGDRDDDDRYDRRDYGRDRRYYGEPVYANTRIWRGNNGRYYCRRENGTTGLLIGAAVGGLAGSELAGRRGDQTLGVILGAAGGAILGRAIDRSNARCR